MDKKNLKYGGIGALIALVILLVTNVFGGGNVISAVSYAVATPTNMTIIDSNEYTGVPGMDIYKVNITVASTSKLVTRYGTIKNVIVSNRNGAAPKYSTSGSTLSFSSSTHENNVYDIIVNGGL